MHVEILEIVRHNPLPDWQPHDFHNLVWHFTQQPLNTSDHALLYEDMPTNIDSLRSLGEEISAKLIMGRS
jgi:hypothetical protein